MNPFEVRLDILKLAQTIVADTSERSSTNTDAHLMYNADAVLRTANQLYSFVDSRTGSKTTKD